tara:strand:+ start:4965 stop:5495 length:531 start_codon:yes stop_codon:yes gene_type:complete
MPNYPSLATTPNTCADWRNDFWENDLTDTYDVTDVDGNVRHVVREPYKSKWRKRKDRRYQNKLNLENGKETPATEMMKKYKITGKKTLHKRKEEKPKKPEHKDTDHQYLVLKNGHWVVNKYSSYDCRNLYADAFYGPERKLQGDKVFRDLNRGWLKNSVAGQTFEAWLDSVAYPKL